MTPKKQAKELVDRFAPLAKYWDCYNNQLLEENNAKQCALIAVDEIIKILSEDINPLVNYWFEVKNEIEKL
jgi:hypothetical protein